jgi:hypothetical protein
MTKEQQRA